MAKIFKTAKNIPEKKSRLRRENTKKFARSSTVYSVWYFCNEVIKISVSGTVYTILHYNFIMLRRVRQM